MLNFVKFFFSNTFVLQDNSARIFVSFKQPPQPPEPFAFTCNQRLVSSLNPLNVVGPAARHFVCFVYFVCFVLNFVFIRVYSWFLIDCKSYSGSASVLIFQGSISGEEDSEE
jgi:hypothetical protein